MVSKVASHDRRNGVYYTPSELSNYLAAPLIDKSKLSVFDPAYGGGSLLLAAEKIHEWKFGKKQSRNLRLFGCDIIPVNGLLKHLPDSNLVAQDFFEYSEDYKFDVILTNPPYVRHHYLSSDKISAYKSLLAQCCCLSRMSDLWAYFMVKSVIHLRNNGAIGAILPWSFLHAEYARDLREWLSNRFREIRLLVVRQPYFKKANERVVIAWLQGYGEFCRSLSVAGIDTIQDSTNYTELSLNQWLSKKVVFSPNGDIDGLLKSFSDDFGFANLGDYADVKVGVVTGANNFFTLAKSKAECAGFKKDNMIPVMTDSRELSGFLASENIRAKVLLSITKSVNRKTKDYILQGEKKQIHQRYHPRHRNPWYALKIGPTPNAFYPYRISKYPYLIENDIRAQSTNSVHRVYFKDLSKTQIRWLQVSSLSAYSQLSVEINSRVYGKGVLKIEPSSLRKTLVFQSDNRNINSVYSLLCEQLKERNRKEAVSTATRFITAELGIPTSISSLAEEYLYEMQARRLDSF